MIFRVGIDNVTPMKEIVHHLLELAATGWGPFILILHGYLESFIFPGPHDIFLVTLCLVNPKMSFVYALMSTTASVCGILTGYFIGRFSEKNILERFFHSKIIDKTKEYIRKYDFWAIAIACFTPAPVKVFAYLAGAAGINIRLLILVAFLARGARFFLISSILYFFGETAKEIIFTYMNYAMLVMFSGMIILFLLMKIIAKKEASKTAESQDSEKI